VWRSGDPEATFFEITAEKRAFSAFLGVIRREIWVE
jgi:hypothetical protein